MSSSNSAKTNDQQTSTQTSTQAEASAATWCPEQQIYIGGNVPGATNQDIEKLLEDNSGCLYVFGYGSLCWNPGSSEDSALGHASVIAHPGLLKGGYQRCWAQRSTDHRGTPSFPGIVCTLLQTHEIQTILQTAAAKAGQAQQQSQSTTTTTKPSSSSLPVVEGMIYKVPPNLARQCLEELDFREKGGYAREIVTVQIQNHDSAEETEEVEAEVQALVYRGTPDNPAFWSRLVYDLPLAASIMSLAKGPSGYNHVYLEKLKEFLSLQQSTNTNHHLLDDDPTFPLAHMTNQLLQQSKTTSKRNLYYLYGCGSNQHQQIINYNYKNILEDDDDEDFSTLMETVLWCNNNNKGADVVVDPPKELFAGGGHSGLLTQSGQLYLWGWNQYGQCGGGSGINNNNNRNDAAQQQQQQQEGPLPLLEPVSIVAYHNSSGDNDDDEGDVVVGGVVDKQHQQPLLVEKVSLGFSHTLFIEKGTNKLYGMGDNSHGQITQQQQPDGGEGSGGGDDTTKNGTKSATTKTTTTITTPIPLFPQEEFRSIAAGVFHSAAITTKGELMTWGNNSHGQCLTTTSAMAAAGTTKWMPPPSTSDGTSTTTRCVDVVVGRHHTAVLDDQGRIWTFGDNKYGQLGRPIIIPAAATATVEKEDKAVETTTTTVTTTSENGQKKARTTKKKKQPKPIDSTPRLVQLDGKCIELQSGWSHLIARVVVVEAKDQDQEEHAPSSSSSSPSRGSISSSTTTQKTQTKIYGWGRNDKGQLGCKQQQQQEGAVATPSPRCLFNDSASQEHARQQLLLPENISKISCGSESTYFLVVDSDARKNNQSTTIYSCGWNEHGNLGIGGSGGGGGDVVEEEEEEEDVYQITQLVDTERIVCPPTYSSAAAAAAAAAENSDNDQQHQGRRQLIMAAGGAHLLVMMT